MYVCMYVRPSHNQIIRLEDEKVNLIENSILKIIGLYCTLGFGTVC